MLLLSQRIYPLILSSVWECCLPQKLLNEWTAGIPYLNLARSEDGEPKNKPNQNLWKEIQT